jgi:alpha-mannosidase
VFGASRVTQRMSLAVDSRRIDFVTQVDWHEERTLLKVAFPVDVHARRATYEIQYGHVERPTHENTSWDVARFEVCAHKWVDLAEEGYGVALLNDCKYGHDIHGNVIRLSLLRSPLWPDPNADRGGHRFTYSLLPHTGSFTGAGVIDQAYDLNVPVRAVPARVQEGTWARRGSLVTVDRPGVIVEAVKLADAPSGDGRRGLIIRLYEAWGGRGPARIDVSGLLARLSSPGGPAGARLMSATRTDLLERPLETLPHDDSSVAITVRPFEIVTLDLRAG